MSQLKKASKLKLQNIPRLLAAHGLLLKQNAAPIIDYDVDFSTDSRVLSASCGFIAYRGVSSDGHDFLQSAIEKSAPFVVCEDYPNNAETFACPVFLVTSARAAWTVMRAESHDNPQLKMKLLGVTGTNGKTSTCWISHHLLNSVGIPSVLIGTMGAWIGAEFFATKHTTPDPDDFFPLLRYAVEKKHAVTVMEVSSHAIAQDKLFSLKFNSAAFTSFSRDHLDFHKTVEDYWEKKCLLFTDMLTPNANGYFCSKLEKFPAMPREHAFRYQVESESRVNIGENRIQVAYSEETFEGTFLEIQLPNKVKISGKIPYFGTHAIENFVAALALSSEISAKVLSPEHWLELPQIPGRLERITGIHKVNVFVDYAHTPDALEKTLEFLRKYTKKALIVVFGCGGDRDRGKRPLMGAIAGRLADKIYLTSDNPRNEDPQAILSEIQSGLEQSKHLAVLSDRKEAIFRAIAESSPGDVILIAGKGHENYQIIGNQKNPFDDRLVAETALNSLNA